MENKNLLKTALKRGVAEKVIQILIESDLDPKGVADIILLSNEEIIDKRVIISAAKSKIDSEKWLLKDEIVGSLLKEGSVDKLTELIKYLKG